MCLKQNFLPFVVKCILFLPRNEQGMSINMNGQIIQIPSLKKVTITSSLFHWMDIYQYKVSTFTSYRNYSELY